MFKKSDQDEARKLLDAYDYNMKNAINHVLQGNFDKASVYHQNMAHTLDQLQQLKNSKKMEDEAWLLLKQLQGEQQQKEFLHRIRGKL